MKAYEIENIRNSLAGIVRTLGEKGVKVKQEGIKAFVKTDAKTGKIIEVCLPYIPDNASEDLIASIQGFLDHEVGHILETDFVTYNNAINGQPKLLQGLVNIIEDIYVERKMGERFKGSKSNLNRMHRLYIHRLTDPDYKTAKATGAHPLTIVNLLMAPAFRAKAKQFEFEEYLKDKWDDVSQWFDKIEDLTDRLPLIKSTVESVEIAQEIYKRWSELDQQMKDEQQGEGQKKVKAKPDPDGEEIEVRSKPEKGDDEQDGEDDQEAASGSGEKSDEEGEDEGEGSEGSEGEEDKEDGEGEQESKSTVIELGDNLSDIEEALSKEISKIVKNDLKSASYSVFTKDRDRIGPPEIDAQKGAEHLTTLEEESKNIVGPLQKTFERILTSRLRAYVTPGQKSGKFHASNAYRLKIGDVRVFKRKEEKTAKNTAVSILVDQSGSMSGRKIKVAMTAAYSLGCVLSKFNTPFEILGFTTQGDYLREEDDGVNYVRAEALDMPVYKGYGERFADLQKKMLATMAYGYGRMYNNVDGECVQIAASRLSRRPEKNKILIVLSDGNPACRTSYYGSLNDHLKQVVKEIESSPMKIMGIGIMDDSVKEFYKNCVVIDEVSELPKVLLNTVRSFILP